MRKAKAIYSELAPAREAALSLYVGRDFEEAEKWESFTVEKRRLVTWRSCRWAH